MQWLERINIKGGIIVVKMYYDNEASLDFLKKKKVAVLGFGSQGHAQGLNLKESGIDVCIGLRKGSKRWQEAIDYGFDVMTVKEASYAADVVQVLLPDEVQAKVYREEIEEFMTEGKALVFSHGFNIHYKQIVPPKYVDVFMVAPKGPGHMVRRMYTQGQGVPSLIAVYNDYSGHAKDLALSYAKGIGATRAGVFETTFKEETETDLFGEQAVLCGGVTELMKAGFDTLVEAGYSPEMAYFECVHEMKLIVDLIYEGGFSNMRYSISDTAEYGDYKAGKRIITKDTRDEMEKILCEIQNGSFAREWILENMANRPFFNAEKQLQKEHNVEEVGERLRGFMPWLKK